MFAHAEKPKPRKNWPNKVYNLPGSSPSWMKQVVDNLTLEDPVNIAAYTSSRTP